MKKVSFIKRSFTFMLVLVLTVLSPLPNFLFSNNTSVVKAASVDTGASKIALNVTSKSLVKDDTYQLQVYNLSDNQKVSYKSDDSAIASVDKEGKVTGTKVGTTIITVTVKDGFKSSESLTCEITVGPPAISVKLTKADITLTDGDKYSLGTILKPNNTAEEAKFSSSDPKVATVSASGRVTARSAGTAIIYATIADGQSDSCIITVTEAKK